MHRRGSHLGWAMVAAMCTPAPSAGSGLDLQALPGQQVVQLEQSGGQRVVRTAVVTTGAGRASGDTIGTLVPLSSLPGDQRFEQANQSAVALVGGGFAATWSERLVGQVKVRVQFIDVDRGPRFVEGGLELGAMGDGRPEPAITAHANGGAVVAFTQDGPGVRSEVRVHWVRNDGAQRWGAEGVSAFGALLDGSRYGYPTLVSHADGDVSVCASRSAFTADDPVTCQRIAPDGSRRWTAQGVQAGGAVLGWRPGPIAVAAGDGDLLVFWKVRPFELGVIRIEGQRFSPSGQRRWGSAARTLRLGRLSSSGFHLSGELRAAGDGAGGAIVQFMDWSGEDTPSNDTLAIRVTQADLLPWQDGLRIGVGDASQQPDGVIPLGDGGAIMGYNDFPEQGSGVRTTLQRVTPEGVLAWGAPGHVLADLPGAMNYNVHGARVGELVQLAWTRDAPADGSAFEARLTALTLDGMQVGPAAGALLAGGSRGQFVRGYAWDALHQAGFAISDSVQFGGADPDDVLGALHLRSTDDVFAASFEAAAE